MDLDRIFYFSYVAVLCTQNVKFDKELIKHTPICKYNFGAVRGERGDGEVQQLQRSASRN